MTKNKKKLSRTIRLDERAYHIIEKQKEILRANGFSRPNSSDAVKLLNGEITVEYTEEQL